VPYHRFAQLIGLKGLFVDHPDQIGPAWDEALRSDVPVVLEVKTDPEVPPLPPHITWKQMKNFMISTPLDPEAGSIIKNTAKEVLASVMPGSDRG
jgi:pyruvate dehydrogenase (quinone)